MSLYNLSDNVNDSFEFEVAKKRFVFRYPLVGEIEDMQSLADEQKKAIESKDQDAIKVANDKLEGFMYNFISPVGENEEDIRSVLKTQNVRVMQNFNTMVKTELGLE